jgi:hypothetical protein
MDKIIGGVFGVAMGVIVIAGIYQLGKKGNPIVPDTASVVNNGLTSIFK